MNPQERYADEPKWKSEMSQNSLSLDFKTSS